MDWLGKVKSLVTGIPDFLDSLFPEPWKCEQCGRPLHHVGKPICSVCAGRMRAILHQKGEGSSWGGVKSVDDVPKCRECGRPLHSPTDEHLCCETCALNMWIDYRGFIAKTEGRQLCKLPGCMKDCYVDDRNKCTYDFCAKTHASQYKQQIRDIYIFGGYGFNESEVECKYPGCDKLRVLDDYARMSSCCSVQHNEEYQQITPMDVCRHQMTKRDPVLFYESHMPFYEFTNFFNYAPFELDGKRWRSSEHYFQAQKFILTPVAEFIRQCAETPREAFQYSRQFSEWQRSDWEDVKLDIMHKALLAKFSQNEWPRQLLVSTGKRKLVEHTYNDSFWGDGGGHGQGSNHLGKLLEKVRTVFAEGREK